MQPALVAFCHQLAKIYSKRIYVVPDFLQPALAGSAILYLALCGGGGGVFSRAMAHILNACIITCTVW